MRGEKGPKNGPGNLAAIRKAYQEEEQRRDDDFQQQMERLLKNLDEFEKGAGDGSVH